MPELNEPNPIWRENQSHDSISVEARLGSDEIVLSFPDDTVTVERLSIECARWLRDALSAALERAEKAKTIAAIDGTCKDLNRAIDEEVVERAKAFQPTFASLAARDAYLEKLGGVPPVEKRLCHCTLRCKHGLHAADLPPGRCLVTLPDSMGGGQAAVSASCPLCFGSGIVKA